MDSTVLIGLSIPIKVKKLIMDKKGLEVLDSIFEEKRALSRRAAACASRFSRPSSIRSRRGCSFPGDIAGSGEGVGEVVKSVGGHESGIPDREVINQTDRRTFNYAPYRLWQHLSTV